MPWHGRYYPGARRDQRARKREAAAARQRAERERDHRRAECRKQRSYTSYPAAALALLDCQIRRVIRGSQRRRETRIYSCRQCGAWHLTSRPDRHAAQEVTAA